MTSISGDALGPDYDAQVAVLGRAAEHIGVPIDDEQLARWRTIRVATTMLNDALWHPPSDDEYLYTETERLLDTVAGPKESVELELDGLRASVTEQRNSLDDMSRLGQRALRTGQIIGGLHRIGTPWQHLELDPSMASKAAELNLWLMNAFGYAYAFDMYQNVEASQAVINLCVGDDNKEALPTDNIMSEAIQILSFQSDHKADHKVQLIHELAAAIV